MTEQADATTDAAARVAALRARSGKPAQVSKILVAGASTTAMFGLVAVMGWQASTESGQPAPVPSSVAGEAPPPPNTAPASAPVPPGVPVIDLPLPGPAPASPVTTTTIAAAAPVPIPPPAPLPIAVSSQSS